MPVTTMSAITTSEAGKQMTMKQKATAKHKMTTEQTITEQQSTSKEVASTDQQSTSKEETTAKRQSTFKEESTTEQQSTSKEETTTKRQSTAKEATTTGQQSTSKEQTTYEQESTTQEQTSSTKHSTTKTQYITMKTSTIKKLATSEEQPTTVARVTILTSSENNMTLNAAKNILNGSLCVCVCKYTNQTLKDSMEKRREQLLLTKTELSSNITKRMSAPDPRKSSTVVGTVAAIILVLFGLLFFSR